MVLRLRQHNIGEHRWTNSNNNDSWHWYRKTDHSFVWMFIEVKWCRNVPSVRVVCIQAFHEQFTSTTNVLYQATEATST